MSGVSLYTDRSEAVKSWDNSRVWLGIYPFIKNLACSRRSDGGARAKNKASERAGKKRGETREEVHYLNAWNRLLKTGLGIFDF